MQLQQLHSGPFVTFLMSSRMPFRVYCTVVLVCAALLAGCAHYAPLPLDSVPSLKDGVAALRSAPSLSTPLTVDQVVTLALKNNPDLKAVRLKRAVAAAQTQQAGILPNPSFSGSFLPLIAGPASIPAWTVGLSQNIRAIITYHAHQRAAHDTELQVDADTVWQEWQIAGRARQLTTDLIVLERSRPVYEGAYQLLAQRDAELEKALLAHNTTLIIVAPDRTALQSARTALNGVDQKILSTRHQLNALLGLEPQARLSLSSAVDLPPFDPAAVRAGLSDLASRRPDLIALRLGYASSDEAVREAILAQFPDLVLGGTGSSDNTGIINAGPAVTIGVPIFDRNQGNIAIAKATRAQLHADYAARLAAATGEVAAMLSEIEQETRQLQVAKGYLPQAEAAAQHAKTAFGANNLDERSYVDLLDNLFAKQEEIMSLELALLERQIAIQTLVGAGLPTAGLPPAPSDGTVE